MVQHAPRAAVNLQRRESVGYKMQPVGMRVGMRARERRELCVRSR